MKSEKAVMENMKVIEKCLIGKFGKEELCEDGICTTKDFIAVIDGFNKPDKELIKCIDIPENVKEIVFVSDGYRKPFGTLKESEEYLKHIKEVDPLCYKEYAYQRGFYKNQEGYDDRAYIRFEI